MKTLQEISKQYSILCIPITNSFPRMDNVFLYPRAHNQIRGPKTKKVLLSGQAVLINFIETNLIYHCSCYAEDVNVVFESIQYSVLCLRLFIFRKLHCVCFCVVIKHMLPSVGRSPNFGN